MAEVLTQFSPRPPHGMQKYPWETWFDGRIWRLVHGEDFTVSPDGFRGSLNSAARKRGLIVIAAIDYKNGVVELQAIIKKGD